MKQILLTTLFILSTFSYGQYTEGNTVVVWSSYKFLETLEGVEGASTKDWKESFSEYYTKRNRKDKLLKSSLFLRHYWTGASWDYHEVNEFASMKDADEWSSGSGDLNQKAWPNKDKRAKAIQAVNKYRQRGYHKDTHVWENHPRYMKKRKKSKTPERTVVTVITQFWKPLSRVENGSADEREKLMDKFFKEVTMKNDKILSQRVLTHYWSDDIDNGHWPLTYIREWASIQDADDTETEAKLVEKAFTEEEQKALGKYWVGKHVDIGVYANDTGFNK